ncbi:hypothetical protein VOLCADRAFT_119636 [Volvox carteri f. nagariensis]|uniref:Uncharacterized protein n=1 Tax=Volvox carteri f. nagariensis TaxID=3068 RepID=D8UEV5_VOLCA|nr:uncharacterized protein VOLCADRAFT_119636 [Volvox carteri f. nagariensis]EFJ41707.1 hypothetical protein VOLCADRAFT_119636 [Volvox carteri f. nagariensis]|eukprot:XP_002957209.1 hypothetical protein VOLCADRAFT_119636 [Volvox carteri f. nagariensis]
MASGSAATLAAARRQLPPAGSRRHQPPGGAVAAVGSQGGQHLPLPRPLLFPWLLLLCAAWLMAIPTSAQDTANAVVMDGAGTDAGGVGAAVAAPQLGATASNVLGVQPQQLQPQPGIDQQQAQPGQLPQQYQQQQQNAQQLLQPQQQQGQQQAVSVRAAGTDALQQQPQVQPRPQRQVAQVVLREECADIPISTSQLGLANMAELIVTGCVHKGLVRCRNNTDDLGDCLLLVEAPVLPDSAPCALTGGQRYMFFLQAQPGPCDGYYYAMFQRAYHSIRRPLGGTGCTFYPDFPEASDMVTRINSQCSGNAAATCSLDRCDPRVTRSPCANDTTTRCDLKQCAGKFMYYNAIMPSETCYELYTYRTSGLPVNCYGQRYINNRIREIELQQALANATAAQTRSARPGSLSQAAVQDDAIGD